MPIFKNLLKISLISLAILMASQSHTMELEGKYWYANFKEQMPLEEILKNHKISPEVAEVINKNLKALKKIAGGAYELSALPNTIIKEDGINRVIGSICIQQCANEYHLDAVKAPTKKVCLSAYPANYAVEPKINITRDPFSLKQIQQICIIIEQTGYFDIHGGNIVNTKNGIAYFIDTEETSFLWANKSPIKPSILLKLLEDLKKCPMEPEAKEWLEQTIKYKTLKFATSPLQAKL